MKTLPQDVDFKISSFCNCGSCNNCVSIAVTEQGVFVRDTKDDTKTTLAFTPDEWKTFVQGVKAGEFDV